MFSSIGQKKGFTLVFMHFHVAVIFLESDIKYYISSLSILSKLFVLSNHQIRRLKGNLYVNISNMFLLL